MNKLCCMNLSLATRIIGAYGLSLSILLLNVSMSFFFSRGSDEEFFAAIESWVLFGLNWTQALKNLNVPRRAPTVMICFLVYILLFLFASAYLALGSITKKPKSAVPWMYLQMISIIDQAAALAIHLTQKQQDDVYDRSMWYIPVSSIYVLISVYFWMIVQAARSEWSNEAEIREEPGSVVTVVQPPSDSNPKTPSFLSQNFSIFQSPRPPVSKYNI